MVKRNFRFCWWHSHHTMSAFWSGTDKIAIDEFDEGDFSFALVVNLKGEYKFRVQMWEPIEAGEDIELGFINSPDTSVPKDIVEEVAVKCSEETYTTYGTSWKQRYSGNGTQLALDPRITDEYDVYRAHQEVKDYNKGFNTFSINTSYI